MFNQYSGSFKQGDYFPPVSGDGTYRSNEESQIFTKKKMNLNMPDNILYLTVSNNKLVCLMANQVLFRVFLLRPEKQDEVFLDKYTGGCKISNIFLDPSGNHLLISLIPKSPGISTELLYLHSKQNKPKRIDKFKNHEITAVAFNYLDGNELTTGPILLGTDKGFIFETEFGIDGDKLYQNNWKQLPNYIPIYGMREIEGLVFVLDREKQIPITGLSFFRVPNTTSFIVLITTTENLYRFQKDMRSDEKLILQNLFSSYSSASPELLHKTIINNDLKYSKLLFTCDMNKKYPKKFVWLNSVGIDYGEILQNADNANFIINEKHLKFPGISTQLQNQTNSLKNNSAFNSIEIPKTLVLTEFHALLLYSDHIVAINTLNSSIISQNNFAEQHGKLLNIIKDEITSTIYAYTAKTIFRYTITNEERDIWKIFLDRNEFVQAEFYSQNNPAHLDEVLCQKAELQFQQKEYEESALIFSETQKSFQDVSLKFLELEDKRPLMIFLNNRLTKLKNDDKIQTTMLVVWIVELYLTEISKCNDNLDNLRELQDNFNNFISQDHVKKCIDENRTVFYDLLASHGDNNNLTMLTTLNKDYESVVNQLINQSKFKDALSILQTQNKPELYYKFCPILMEEIPEDTIMAIKQQKTRLNPERLIPTIICLQSEEHINWVINYLEYASITNHEKPIHNFLIKLYAKYRKDKLQTYLELQGRDVSIIHYDRYYALRVCEEHEAKEACVFLQCLLELWESAVELALTFNSKLAEDIASQPPDIELKRKLWLKIAEHEIKGKNDVKRALELLKECSILKIEDILPFFSDFEKIDDFKTAICDALKEYNLRNQEQQHDMEESSKSADSIRHDLQSFRNRHMIISSNEICSICEIYLMIKPFFIFPCGHKFHGDCLEKQITPYLNRDESMRLSNLKRQLESSTSLDASNNHQISGEQIKAGIEKILASDCFYCGIMINAIDKPFIEDWDQVNVDWE